MKSNSSLMSERGSWMKKQWLKLMGKWYGKAVVKMIKLKTVKYGKLFVAPCFPYESH